VGIGTSIDEYAVAEERLVPKIVTKDPRAATGTAAELFPVAGLISVCADGVCANAGMHATKNTTKENMLNRSTLRIRRAEDGR
jgi:hypothetical protein